MDNHESLKAQLKTLKNSLDFEKEKLIELSEYKNCVDLRKQITEIKNKLLGDEKKKEPKKEKKEKKKKLIK